MEELAYAKLNLSLDVLGLRPDGFHDLRMVMQSISLCDRLTIERTDRHGDLRVRSSLHYLPLDGRNLAGKAALQFYQSLGQEAPGIDIQIEKHIPVCAGMAGGSSDAAAVLRALNRMEGEPYTVQALAKVGESVGSDVPYCVLGGTALAEGRGEQLTPLPALPSCHVVVCKPNFPISTPELFAAIDRCRLRRRPNTPELLAALEAGDLPGVARRMYNVFTDVLPPRQQKQVLDIQNTLIQSGALGAGMSGTGPTAFGLFTRAEEAQAAAAELSQHYQEVFLAEGV